MRMPVLLSGLILLIGGGWMLPPAPASPEDIGASLALVAFFFGGTYLFSGLFSIKHPAHGNAAILLLSLMGVIYSIYLFFSHQLMTAQLWTMIFLFMASSSLFLLGMKQWKKSQRLKHQP